jgi:hypothetical protein
LPLTNLSTWFLQEPPDHHSLTEWFSSNSSSCLSQWWSLESIRSLARKKSVPLRTNSFHFSNTNFINDLSLQGFWRALWDGCLWSYVCRLGPPSSSRREMSANLAHDPRKPGYGWLELSDRFDDAVKLWELIEQFRKRLRFCLQKSGAYWRSSSIEGGMSLCSSGRNLDSHLIRCEPPRTRHPVRQSIARAPHQGSQCWNMLAPVFVISVSGKEAKKSENGVGEEFKWKIESCNISLPR